MPLFPKIVDMILELDKLENLMPSYAEPLCDVSKFIRTKLWPVSDEKRLAAVLDSLNMVFGVVVDALGEQLDFVEWYVIFLHKYCPEFSFDDMTEEFAVIILSLKQYKTQELMKLHWKRINPYFSDQFVDDERFEKNIIQLLEDAFTTSIDLYPKAFFIKAGNVGKITRGRRGVWRNGSELLPPTVEIAKKKNIINRWNPPDKRYLYLSHENHSSNIDNECVCFEEMRCSSGETATFADFAIVNSAKNKIIINLDYETLERKDLIEKLEQYAKSMVDCLIPEIISSGIVPSLENIQTTIKSRHSKTEQEVNIFAGKLFLKELCDAIFVPLDTDEDSDNLLKDKCYKSFHVLAEYFESRGISGIIYPSTRTKPQGQNLVLFDMTDAQPIQSSFRTKSKT